MQQGMKSLGNRSVGPLGYGSNHRGESRKRVGAALRFGALRNLTGDHRWPECRGSSPRTAQRTAEQHGAMMARSPAP